MNNKVTRREAAIFGFDSPTIDLVKEDSPAFRRFVDRLERDLAKLENDLREFERPPADRSRSALLR